MVNKRIYTKSRNRQHRTVTEALTKVKVDLRRQARKRRKDKEAKKASQQGA